MSRKMPHNVRKKLDDRLTDLLFSGVENALQTHHLVATTDAYRPEEKDEDHQRVYGATETRIGTDYQLDWKHYKECEGGAFNNWNEFERYLIKGVCHLKRKWKGKYYFYKVTVQEMKEEKEGHY
jgi:hypothetical protein